VSSSDWDNPLLAITGKSQHCNRICGKAKSHQAALYLPAPLTTITENKTHKIAGASFVAPADVDLLHRKTSPPIKYHHIVNHN
jgi:hypothetical protein